MTIDIRSTLTKHLDAKEKLIWTGRPKSGIMFKASDIFMIPFSVIWCSFAIFWLYMVVSSGGPFFMTLFGIPFVMVGLMFVFGRFIIDAKIRSHTFYGLTENRVLIQSGVFSKKIQSLNLKTIGDLELVEKKDGRGTISIGPKNPFMVWGGGMNWWPGIKTTPQLESIRNARKVYQEMIKIQNEG